VVALVGVDHALDLRRQGKSFIVNGDHEKAEVLLTDSVQQLEAVCAAMPLGFRLADLSKSLLTAWHRRKAGDTGKGKDVKLHTLEKELETELNRVIMEVESVFSLRCSGGKLG